MDFVLDLLQGAGLAAAIGIRPFLPVLLAGALASADLGIDFAGTDFAFLESGRSCSPCWSSSWRSTSPAGAPAATPPTGRRCCTPARRVALVLGALVAAGSVADRSDAWWAGVVVGVGLRGARLPGRALAVRPRAPAPGRAGGRTRCRSTPRARRWPPPACLDPLPAARDPRDRRARLAARRRPPARAARSTRACASCAERRGGPQEARPRGHRRDEARDARAGGRVRPGAGARAADGARAPRRRLRRGVPLGHAGVLGVDRDRRGAGPPPHPVDELVPPRRGALRRVRDQLQGLAGVRLQALAHRHDLQHERRAPLGGHADGVRDARRRRRAHRRHDLPDVPRPPPARADAPRPR